MKQSRQVRDLPHIGAAKPLEVHGDEIVMRCGDRRYRVRGLAKNLSFDQMKVNVLASRCSTNLSLSDVPAGFHVDTIEMYAARQRRFVYDRWGNRTQVWNATVGGTQIQHVNLALIGSAPSNRVSSYWDTAATGGATKTVSYDEGGNVTNDGTYTFTYDAENRIVQANSVATGALVATYTYDSANRRIKKTVGSATTCYIWEGAQVIAEYNNAAAPASPNTEYIFTGGRMLAEERTGSGTTRFFHQDRLSTRLTTNSTGERLSIIRTQSRQ